MGSLGLTGTWFGLLSLAWLCNSLGLIGLLGLACCLGLPGIPCASSVLLEIKLKLVLLLAWRVWSCLVALPSLALSRLESLVVACLVWFGVV